jgi:XTP/dITP diphosphohydrolase|tara:strand:- start:605 stop:1153 length:549 start_codon:yes stop_codon:yes gene_type:complete
MTTINFITSNKNKVLEARQILEPEIKVNHIELEYDEIRSDNPEDIANESSKYLAKKLNKTVVVEDSGLFITALNGFPGTCSSYIHKRIGLEGILKLMENKKNRNANYQSSVSICQPNQKPIAFSGEEKGTISNSIKGKHGFGHDPIFLPENFQKTYGELENFKELKQFRRIAFKKLKKYLSK